MKSCIYEGRLRHRRSAPVVNEFDYPLFLLYLDLHELPAVFDGKWLWSARRPALARFRRSDHLGPEDQPLDVSVRELVAKETGFYPEGPIRLLTHLRYLGYGFNPVSFYYCFDREERDVTAIVAEVNNTPWGEQHAYVLREAAEGPVKRFELKKQFHVSPYMGMDMEYRWSFSVPGERLVVHMENLEAGNKVFDATLTLKREPLTGFALNRRLVSYPAMTLQVISRIYWQALKLWWKQCPRYPHPA
jgi:DUF1365 family protein